MEIDETADRYDLTLFIACYNEEQGVLASIKTAMSAAEAVGLSYEIIVIDDASTDASADLIKQFICEHPQVPIKLVVNEVNQGVGANYVKAAFFGHGRYYRMVCGDDVETLEVLVSIFSRIGEADIILSYHTDTSARTFFRCSVSRAFTLLVNVLSGYRIKYYNGLAVHLRYNILRWHTNSHGFGFQAENVTRLLGLGATYLEVPVVAGERASGRSKAFTTQNMLSVAHVILEVFIGRLRRMMFPRLTSVYKRNEAVFCTPSFESAISRTQQRETATDGLLPSGRTKQGSGS